MNQEVTLSQTQKNNKKQKIKTNNGIAGLIVVLILAVPLLPLVISNISFVISSILYGMNDIEDVLYTVTFLSFIILMIFYIMTIYKSIKSVASYNTSKIISYQNRVKSVIYIKTGLLTSIVMNTICYIINHLFKLDETYLLEDINTVIVIVMYIVYIIASIRLHHNKKILCNLIVNNIKSHNNTEK